MRLVRRCFAFFGRHALELAATAPGLRAGEYEILASSFLGAAGFDDSVVGARIQTDGTIALAADLGPGVKVPGQEMPAPPILQ